MKALLLTLLLSIGLNGIVFADDAYDAYQNKDFKTAFNEYHQRAEQGEAKAQTNLALMYLKGEGVSSDQEKAIYWLRKAAEQGLATAQYMLGWSYGFDRWGKQYFENIEAHLIKDLIAALDWD